MVKNKNWPPLKEKENDLSCQIGQVKHTPPLLSVALLLTQLLMYLWLHLHAMGCRNIQSSLATLQAHCSY